MTQQRRPPKGGHSNNAQTFFLRSEFSTTKFRQHFLPLPLPRAKTLPQRHIHRSVKNKAHTADIVEIENVSVSTANIENMIFNVRGVQVMIDSDIAALYGIETRALNQAVKRNIDRFPTDFMFQLTKSEFENLKSQFVTSSSSHLISQLSTNDLLNKLQ